MANRPYLRSFLVFLAQTPIYAGAAAAYFLLVLHFLGRWIKEVHERNRFLYALVALGLICAQGVVLELITRIAELFMRRAKK